MRHKIDAPNNRLEVQTSILRVQASVAEFRVRISRPTPLATALKMMSKFLLRTQKQFAVILVFDLVLLVVLFVRCETLKTAIAENTVAF